MADRQTASSNPAESVDEGQRTPGTLPPLSLPKGGGAIRGIGEKLAVNPSTGTSSLTFPITVSSGRAGFTPELTLTYDSGAGNGIFGFGWSLNLPSISRRTDRGIPRYDEARDSDTFILSGSEDLVRVLTRDGAGKWHRDVRVSPAYAPGWRIERYCPRTEALFSVIERWTDLSTNHAHWRSISIDNITSIYGRTDASRIADPASPERVFQWLLCEQYDDKGNVIHFVYKKEDGAGVETAAPCERSRLDDGRFAARYLKSVRYGNRVPYVVDEDLAQRADWLFEAIVDYGEHDANAPTPAAAKPWPVRADAFSTYRGGFDWRTYRLCRRVLMFHHVGDAAAHPLDEAPPGNNCLVRSTDFGYRETARASFLSSITLSGYRRRAAGGYRRETMPPIEFDYSEAIVDDELRAVVGTDGEPVTHPVDSVEWRWVDLDGEGVAGVLARRGNGWYYRPNTGNGSLGPSRLVASWPSIDTPGAQTELLDVTGEGRVDLVELARPLAGFYDRTPSGHWDEFRGFASQPVLPPFDRAMRFADLTGDGRSDVLLLEGDAVTWWQSLGETGFAAPERLALGAGDRQGPRAVFTNPIEAVHLADMTGDGMSDVVRITSGEVCYWPNLGYGRFGAPIRMGNCPAFDAPRAFDPRRIRLADIDGTGTTDLIYLGRNGVTVWFNESGNSFSAPTPLRGAPVADSLEDISVLDLFGRGTACLVFSTRLPGVRSPLSYIDLMSGTKPHLLTTIRNNIGLETTLTYTSSTELYLRDQQLGRPWLTRLAFPVNVVTRIEHVDRVTGTREVNRYAYRDGYYDGVEREFRGFALVEQSDTDEVPWTGVVGPGDAAHAWRSPARRTRTWFHTGADLDVTRASSAFGERPPESGGYFRNLALGDGSRAFLLDDSVLPSTLTATERREALRALKGQVLRQEVYGDDAADAAGVPYFAVERNYHVHLLQPATPSAHAVFFTRPLETVQLHLERSVDDPRIVHDAVLEVDDYGNVLGSVSVAYGRKPDLTDARLTPADRDQQARTFVLFTETDYTTPLDTGRAYRGPVECERRTYQLFNLKEAKLPGDRPRPVAFDDLVDAIAESAAHPLPFTDFVGAGAIRPFAHRRLIEQVRHLFYDDTLAGPKVLGTIDTLGLQYATYKLAVSKALVDLVYVDNGPQLLPAAAAAAALAEGGYVHGRDLKMLGWFPATDDDDVWWVPSAQALYSPVPALPAPPMPPQPIAQNAAFARAHFFLPQASRDPYGSLMRVDYDAFQLFTVRSEDPAGNVLRATIDYRVLNPYFVEDPNGNRTSAVFDARAMLVAVAVAGKVGEPFGDRLDGVTVDPTQAEIDAFFADPRGAGGRALLADATTRFVYDVNRFVRTAAAAQPMPLYVATLGRERHSAEGQGPGRIIASIVYADGTSREVQRKAPAEPGAVDSDPQQAARWVGSGWTIFSNKGNPVRTYEPFFTRLHEFEAGQMNGVSMTRLFDPLDRTVAVLHPNHTYEKGLISPWRVEHWDVNDTVDLSATTDPDIFGYTSRIPAADLLPTWATRMAASADADERGTVAAARASANTPTVTYLDALGRACLTIAQNRRSAADAIDAYSTRSSYDAEGSLRAVVDARGRTVVTHDYDYAGNRLTQRSMDAGTRWALNDVNGRTIRAWDQTGTMVRHEYDTLRRCTAVYVTEGGVERLAEQMEFGETEPQPEKHNRRGRVVRIRDGAGIVENDVYDFKGNVISSTRRYLDDHATPVDWTQAPAVTNEPWTTASAFDAINRPTRVTTPDGSVFALGYNDAGLFESIAVGVHGAAPAPIVTATEYDQRGGRTLVSYQNGVTTAYRYERDTFRISSVVTTRPDADPDQRVVQDLRYIYDPVGNPCHVVDRADLQNVVYFRNRRVEPSATYTYDAIYRLIEATGREHLGLGIGGAVLPPTATRWDDAPRTNLAHPGDGGAMGTYREVFEYDAVGNVSSVQHVGTDPGQPGWARTYAYNEPSAIGDAAPSNRLSSTTMGAQVEAYVHDIRGNMTRLPHLSAAPANMTWDYASRLVSVDRGGGGRVHCQYDTNGRRVRQVWEKGPNLVEERLYLGPFEVFRVHNGGAGPSLERQALHVADDQGRIALIETRTIGVDPGAASLTRYQHGNLLRSAMLELDQQARVISYEEFYPFGASSYQAFTAPGAAPKRFRFTGEERDEATGFNYHAARYYAPWLARWTSCDPKGLADGTDLYAYARNAPTRLVDSSGLGGEDTSEPVLMKVWDYAQKVADRASLGTNVQGDHPIQVSLRRLETMGEYNRALSKLEHEFVVLAETGTGKFHTELGKLQREIGIRKIAGDLYQGLKTAAEAKGLKVDFPPPDPRMIMSESELVAETLKAYEQAAKATGATLKEGEALKAMISHLGVLSKSGGSAAEIAQKLENAPEILKIIDAVSKSTRWAKALELLEPVLAVSKPILKKAGPIGVVIGVVCISKEAKAATTAAANGNGGDAAIHTLDTIKEGMYLGSMRVPHLLIPAIAISATEYADEKIGFSDAGADDGVKVKEWVQKKTGSENFAFGVGAVASVGMSWTYALTPIGWGLMVARKL